MTSTYATHPSNCLICSLYPSNGTIENWNYQEGYIQVSGSIHGDTKGRWPDGRPITTSRIVNIDIESGHLRTAQSNYILGRRAVDTYCRKCRQERIDFDELSQAIQLCSKCQTANMQALQDAGAFDLHGEANQ